MHNVTIFNKLINEYRDLSYAKDFIFGFSDRKNIYISIVKSEMLPYICCLDKASRNAGYSLRFKPTKAQKELLKMHNCKVLCSLSVFNNEYLNSKYNRGEIFEKLIHEFFNREWKKDSVPFTADGDITINNISYQIKFENATFCNEKSIINLKNK